VHRRRHPRRIGVPIEQVEREGRFAEQIIVDDKRPDQIVGAQHVKRRRHVAAFEIALGGRTAREGSLFCEVAEGIHAYSVASHRHAPEIEQGLSIAAGRRLVVNFTPHLMPMNRGLLSTIYVRLAPGATLGDLRAVLESAYRDEPFVRLLPEGGLPATRHVRGTNLCLVGLSRDRVANRAILVSALDNLVKGASGQAIQNMNAMLGIPETTALEHRALFPDEISGRGLSQPTRAAVTALWLLCSTVLALLSKSLTLKKSFPSTLPRQDEFHPPVMSEIFTPAAPG
jgi:hypothetical protein